MHTHACMHVQAWGILTMSPDASNLHNDLYM